MAYNPAGEVDTLNLLSDKLDALLTETQGYYESFLDINTLYKQGQVSDKEFFQKMGDYVVAYSALEFLVAKVLLEVKKATQSGSGMTQSPGLMPGMGTPQAGSMGMGPAGMAPAGMGPAGTAANPVGGPPGIVSAGDSFSKPGTLPAPDPSLVPRKPACSSCGAPLKPNAKFCTSCGARL